MIAKTIIIGGGMAGMSCALTLLEANRDFLLVTDGLGGRIKYDTASKVNYGAYFVMQNYSNASKVVLREDYINPLKVRFHNSPSDKFSLLSWKTAQNLPGLLKFVGLMLSFSKHYGSYKTRCMEIGQEAALKLDPYMSRVYQEPASKFIRDHGLQEVADNFLRKFAYACTGADTEQLNTLDFLNVCMGLLLPIYRFRFDSTAMEEKLGQRLVLDTITKIEEKGGKVILTGRAGGTFEAENVVVATPASTTRELLRIGKIRGASKIFVYHVYGRLKKDLENCEINLFPYESRIMLTARQFDGSYLIYSREEEAGLSDLCDEYTLLRKISWNEALFIEGDSFLQQQFGDNIFIAGDHNGLGLEPAAISGIFAANQVITKTKMNEER